MTEIRIYLMERREVYRLHFLKSFAFPLAFPAYRNVRTALKWAWNVRVNFILFHSLALLTPLGINNLANKISREWSKH